MNLSNFLKTLRLIKILFPIYVRPTKTTQINAYISVRDQIHRARIERAREISAERAILYRQKYDFEPDLYDKDGILFGAFPLEKQRPFGPKKQRTAQKRQKALFSRVPLHSQSFSVPISGNNFRRN